MRTRLAAGLAAALLLAMVASAAAQRGRFAISLATERDFDGGFQFCRAAFRQNPNGDGGGWSVDYPQADENVSIRLSELTKTRVSFDRRQPRHLVVRLTDPTLFGCPFVMMTEVGAAYLDPSEALALRDYLDKGGFLWVDDFWGDYAWSAWEEQLRKALPAGEFPIVDLPLDHALYRSHLVLPNGVPQISSINFWLRAGHASERGTESRQPHGRAVLDRHGRVMVFMTHNTDIGDSWEREGEDPNYFRLYSVNGYALGMDVLVYAMTH